VNLEHAQRMLDHLQNTTPPSDSNLGMTSISPEFDYLATPYQHYTGGLKEAYHDARLIVSHFALEGRSVYSPIVYWHHIARASGMNPIDHEIWLPLDKPFMFAARALIVGMLPGWKQSKGVKAEIDFFKRAGKPIDFYDPEEEMFE
jgi:hypothetical protein